MDKEKAAALSERLANDEALRQRLSTAESGSRWRLLQETGLDVSAEDEPDIDAACGVHELSEEDLKSASGGMAGAGSSLLAKAEPMMSRPVG